MKVSSDKSEYFYGIYNICRQVVSVSNGMGSEFLYESAKDVLKWNNLSVEEHVKTVMRIGGMIHMEEKRFEELKNENEFLEISVEDLKQILE